MSSNLDLYNKFRLVPAEALKDIQAGRLKGKSDINPMWRIKTLTEQFGPCGFGWKYTIDKMWNEQGGNGEISSFVLISLFIKVDDKWSEAIPGVGGSSFVANESKGPYTSDECYKMALTDAISVACKALGVAADVYYQNDRTKYTQLATQQPQLAAKAPQQPVKKVLPKEKWNDIQIMAWIYKREMESKQKDKRFSPTGLIESSYANTSDEINLIVSNYQQYKINNNL